MFFQEEAGKLLAFYTKGEEVIAVLTLGRDPLAARYKVFERKRQKEKLWFFRFANLRKAGGRLARAEATAWADDGLDLPQSQL